MRYVVALLLLLTIVSPTHAQEVCMRRDDLADVLYDKYGEVPVGRGLTTNGRLLEIFASLKGSWTLVLTWPSKVSCIYKVGQDWSEIAPTETGKTAELPTS